MFRMFGHPYSHFRPGQFGRISQLASVIAVLSLLSGALPGRTEAVGVPGEIVIEEISPASPYPGQSVYLNGIGFGEDGALGTVLVNGDASPVASFWSNELVIFEFPHLGGMTEAVVEVFVEPGLLSNPVLVQPVYPSKVLFVNLMPGYVASGPELTVRVVPEFDQGQVELVSFLYRALGDLPWTPFAVDEDGRGEQAGTSDWIGEGDGWSAVLPVFDLSPGVYEIRAEAIDLHGQFMAGEFPFLYDPTPLAPHILIDGSELGASLQDKGEIKIDIELTDEEIAELLISIFPINWHRQRDLKKVRQDTLKVIDEDGNDVSIHACGPAAAASCLTWFRDRFPGLDKDPADLARKIAKAAGTGSDETDTDDLITAIKKILKDCGQDPADWGVSIEFDKDKVYRDMVQGLSKEGTDKIPLLYQRSTEDLNADGVVDDGDVTGHFVTMSSRGSRYRDFMIPPTTHLIIVERYIDFFNPATGVTEEYQIDDTKTPPELIGYDMNDTSTGNAWVEAVICVRPPAASDNRSLGATACGWGHQLDEPVFEIVSVPGPGIVTWTKAASDLPFGPGPALLGLFGQDSGGCNSGELYTEILVGGFAHVDFSSSATSGTLPLDVSFANLTAPTDSVTAWEWDFDEDGVTDSVEENPTFTYTTPGLYSVSLRAHNPHGSDHRVHKDLIEVLDPTSSNPPMPMPGVTRLFPASPNPAGPETNLRFELAQTSDVQLVIYDVRGRAIWRESWVAAEAGAHEVRWQTRDRRGHALSSGVYYIRMRASGGVERWGTLHILR